MPTPAARKRAPVKASFPWFGGKGKVAEQVWDRLGDVDNYIEPFSGSAAVLLARPHDPRVETLNDLDCMVANFWRAVSQDPEAVAGHADNPVNEADLHARHRWLVGIDHAPPPALDTPYARALTSAGYLAPVARPAHPAALFRERMKTDPEYFDARIAGWWCWGACCWIGSGWCQTPQSADWNQIPHTDARGVPSTPREDTTHEQRPPLGDRAGRGGHRAPAGWQQKPHLADWNHQNRVHPVLTPREGRPQLADKYGAGRGVNANQSAGTCEERRAWLVAWFRRLQDRLRLVRVCCGDWRRVCDSPSVTTRLGTVGIFFDPPYGADAGRDPALYATDSLTVAADVRAYCLERGADRRYRIALCGYAGEGHEELERHGWDAVSWKANGGYSNRSKKGNANANARKERIWFSPHTLRPARTLFD